MVVRISQSDAEHQIHQVLSRVDTDQDTVIVERSGAPIVAVVPYDEYDRVYAERAARFEVLDRLRSRLPDVDEDEVTRDVAEALAVARLSGVARSS